MAQDDAVIRVRLDMDQLDRDLREVERRGGRAASRVAGGASQGGGKGSGQTGGGGGKGGGSFPEMAGMLPGGKSGMLARGLGAGAGVAGLALAAFTANFPSTAAGAVGVGKGVFRGMTSPFGDIANAASQGPAAGVEAAIYGDRAANARGNMRALDQTVAAASLAVGFGADADTFAPYFEAVQNVEQRRERGALELRRRFGGQVTAETLGAATGANSDKILEIGTNIQKLLAILVQAARQGSLLGQLGLK